MIMPGTILTETRVKALWPRGTAYDIRNRTLKGFGVRVSPSGCKRYFVHCQHRGERFWKIVGDAETVGTDEARSCAVRTLAATRRGEGPPRDPAETRFEAVAETVFERHRRLWKPGTLAVNRGYLKNQILPHFQGRQVDDIDRQSVRNWFASLRATPVSADRSMPVQLLYIIPHNFDLDHLRAIHRHLFQDIYEWAGQFRTVDIAEGESRFQP